jgi:hypothetical protein
VALATASFYAVASARARAWPGEVIGVTIINAKWLLERDGYLTITLPQAVRIEAADVAPAPA